ncbi:hypothetical protein N7G274_001680 [Stereocaulon virgatum]|uniref:Uncharacterized protein n=1 Tax=Stereocaulon virgatum TaxID=373712 RepID=A0ABR4AM87_9LECA
MTTQAKTILTTIALETQRSADAANAMSIEILGGHTFNSISAIPKSRMGRHEFIVQHFDPCKADKAYEELDLQLHISPQNSIQDLDATTLKARLDDLVKAVAEEHLSRLCPNLTWDPNRGKPLEKNAPFPPPFPSLSAFPQNNIATTTTPITANLLTHRKPEAPHQTATQLPPTNRYTSPTPLKEYPPYVFIPDTQRHAAETAYFEGRIP